MRILLTGAAGFLGTAIQFAIRSGDHSIITTDQRGDVDFIGNLSDMDFVARLPDVDTVIHAAAVQYVTTDLPLWNRQDFFMRNNVSATENLCTRYSAQNVRFVNVGTSMMYRQCNAPYYAPGSEMEGCGVYSHSKILAQKLIEANFSNWATVIPCIIGGPGREGLFKNFVRMIRGASCVVFPGRGEYPVHLVHVDDVASLLTCILKTDAKGFFNAGAPDPISILGWVKEIADELDVPGVSIYRLPLRPVQMISAATGYRVLAREQIIMLGQPHVLDISASLALGWMPKNDNRKIVRDIARFISEKI